MSSGPSPQAQNLPRLAGHLPGTGGTIKHSAADFIVEEIPLYEACGSGEHIYLRITREDRETRELVRQFTKMFALREADIGTAGLKDRTARATQTFSLHAHKLDPEEVARRIENELAVKVDAVSRHTNKLRTGHLAGNRFRIRVSDTHAQALEFAQARAAVLADTGLPNYYGEQRFGKFGDNARRGKDLVFGRSTERPGKWLKRFLISAYQSELFNRWLAARIDAGQFQNLLAGDVARRTDSGGLFVVEDLAQERPRFESGEIEYTGPIFGKKMTRPSGPAAEAEEQLLAGEAEDGQLLQPEKLGDGSRRPARLAFAGLELAIEPGAGGAAGQSNELWFSFRLPPGSYATTVLAEFL